MTHRNKAQAGQGCVEFLLLVGRRDVAGIRAEGLRLLQGDMELRDPGFHAYVLVATGAVCTQAQDDAACRAMLSRLDLVRRAHPLFDLLRAHRTTQR